MWAARLSRNGAGTSPAAPAVPAFLRSAHKKRDGAVELDPALSRPERQLVMVVPGDPAASTPAPPARSMAKGCPVPLAGGETHPRPDETTRRCSAVTPSTI